MQERSEVFVEWPDNYVLCLLRGTELDDEILQEISQCAVERHYANPFALIFSSEVASAMNQDACLAAAGYSREHYGLFKITLGGPLLVPVEMQKPFFEQVRVEVLLH